MSGPSDVKCTWIVPDEARTSEGHRVTMRAADRKVCNGQCPWLVANHGKTLEMFYDHEVPGIPAETVFTYAAWKRARIWNDNLTDGVCGYGSLCHVRMRGTRMRRDQTWEVVSRQCVGALVMQQREVLRHVENCESALTLEGAARVAGDMLGRAVSAEDLAELDIRELFEHTHPSLLDLEIGSDAVAPPLSEREIREWKRLRDPG